MIVVNVKFPTTGVDKQMLASLRAQERWSEISLTAHRHCRVGAPRNDGEFSN